MEQLVAILRTLSRHWLKLTLLPILAMAAIFYLTKDQSILYKSEAKLFLNIQDSKGTSLSEESLKQFQIATYFQNLSELLESESTLEKVQLSLIRDVLNEKFIWQDVLDTLPTVEMSLRLDTLIRKNQYLDSNQPIDRKIATLTERVPIEDLRDMVMSFRITDSYFFKMELTTDHPLKAQRLLRYFIVALDEENTRLSKNKIRHQQEMMEKLVKEAKASLDAKIRELEKYKVGNRIINLGEHTKAIVVYLVQLEGQRATLLSKIAASEQGKKEVLQTAQNGNEMALDLTMHEEVLEMKKDLKSRKVKNIREKLDNNEIELTKLADYKHADEVEKDELEEKLRSFANKATYDPSRIQLELANRYLGFDLDSETAREMLQIINNEIKRVTDYSVKFAPFESTIGSLEREINTAQNAYLTLLNKLNHTSSMVTESGENAIEVIDTPIYPEAMPSKRIIMVAGSGIAIFTMISAVLIMFQLISAAITNVKKLENVSRFKVAAALPFISNITNEQLKRSAQTIRKQQQVLLFDQMEPIRREGRNIFLICSNQTAENKKEFALDLKKVLEYGKQSVGLIDADWLTNYKTEEMLDISELVQDGNIHFNRDDVRKEVYAKSKEFDWVFVIIPSLNLCTDYRIWFEMFGRAIHIFRAGRIRNHADERMEDYISNLHLDFYALVMNDIEVEEMENYLGEIPKPTNKIRKGIKKLLYRDFNHGNR